MDFVVSGLDCAIPTITYQSAKECSGNNLDNGLRMEAPPQGSDLALLLVGSAESR